jgi:trehalose synthase
MLTEIPVRSRSLARFQPIVGDQRLEEIRAAARKLTATLGGRTIWTLNSTAAGGGVAELLHSLLGYCRGMGLEARWLVVSGRPDFFRITKRLHNALHGSAGDGSPLGKEERGVYEEVLAGNADHLESQVRRGDMVILHDPQTAGLIPRLSRLGAVVIWRCHIGGDLGSDEVRRGWRFLEPYLEPARAFVFSRREYVPPLCDSDRTVIIQPSIDPFSVKNQDLEEDVVRSILVEAALVAGPNGFAVPEYVKGDGTRGVVKRQAKVVREGEAPAWDTPLVVQVSRWDNLKDPVGVLAGFARINSTGNGNTPHLAAGSTWPPSP